MDGARTFEPGVYAATITARSSDTPTLPNSLTYTIELAVPGIPRLEIENVRPSFRASDNWDPDPSNRLEVIPFEVGQRVLVSVIPQGSRDDFQIHEQEIGAWDSCDEG